MIALLFGGVLGRPGLYAPGAGIGAIIIALMITLRQDELVAVTVIAASLYLDFYLGLSIVSLTLAITLLCIFFLTRSHQRPWVEPRSFWLWFLFLGLTIVPAIRGALTMRDALLYYPGIVFGALIMFWLGTVIARDTPSIRRFFKILTIFGVLIALHTIIQAVTGKFLLESSSANAYLASMSDYQLSGNISILRAGSFFIQPNFNGTFFAIMIFIPLGLFVESSSFLGKVLYLAEAILMLPALLFTYSAGAWIAAGVGLIVFVIFVGRARYCFLIASFIVAAALVIFIGFSSQFNSLLQHASDPAELVLRNGIWQTALRVIRTYPLTGVGLGHLAYQQSAEPLRGSADPFPYDHPHNSYLEWGAMGGIPVLFVFLLLISFVVWQALRNWARVDVRTRALLGAGIAAIISLSVASWSNQGWTLPPLAALGWLILGAISSPLLMKNLGDKGLQKKTSGRGK
ncbi:MAG: hypothetical protein NVS4B7_04340 [Ktedonobacteraceae bacterium]